MRLLIDPPAVGAWNMAIDEALLESAIEHGVATLRFYQWSEPTLSLGYFQRYADRERHAASRNCSCVRRHSGGGAILHDRELTYSLALPAKRLTSRQPETWYRMVHTGLVALLGGLLPRDGDRGLQLCPASRKLSPADEPFLCFQRRSEGDLLAVSAAGSDDKIAGSAQRKRRGALLQHGSLLLERSPAAPELPGLGDLSASKMLPIDSITTAWAESLAEQWAGELKAGELSSQEAERAGTIFEQRFATDAWTRRR